jgi:hypothetical protein
VNATHAHELDGSTNWRHITTLAAAYAEDSQFDKAVEWQTKAIELAATDKDKQDARSRLELDKQKKPYHEKAKK